MNKDFTILYNYAIIYDIYQYLYKMDETLKEIKNVIEKFYNIGLVASVDRFNLSYSKFINQNFHFLIKTFDNTYFLKRYHKSHLKNILSEIESVKKVNKKLNTPKIIKSKNKTSYIVNEDSVFVMYEYIDAPNLKETGIDLEHFFDIICKVNSVLIKHNGYYDFKSHILKFETQLNRLLKEPELKMNLEYIEFLGKEVKAIKPYILKLNIPKTFIHRDLLMQNLILDKNKTLWVLDWEKALEYIMVVDVIRSITFTIFNPKDMRLDVDILVKWINYCFKKINLSEEETSNAMNLFYFYLITKTNYLFRLYVHKQELNKKRIEEDSFICKWFKKHKDEIQDRII